MGIKVIGITDKGKTAIRSYVGKVVDGSVANSLGMSKVQVWAAKRVSKILPYSEEYFDDPDRIVVTLSKIIQSQSHLVIPKIEVMLKNMMSKLGAKPKDYRLEVF